MNLDERHLTQLAMVVEAGSVMEAALRLGLTQPAVSRTLSLLQARVGQPLFEPGRRPLRPTALGLALAEQGSAIANAARRAAAAVDRVREGTGGLLRVGGTPFFTDSIVTPMIATFQNDVPNTRVVQTTAYTDELVARLKASRIDLAICPVDVLEEGSGLAFEPLLMGRNVVACNAAHPLVGRRPLRPEHLLDYAWIAPPPGSPLAKNLNSFLQSLGVGEVSIRFSGGSIAGVLAYLSASDVIALLPASVVFAHRNSSNVVPLSLTVEKADRPLGLLTQRDASPTALMRRFADHIRKGLTEFQQLMERHRQAVVWR